MANDLNRYNGLLDNLGGWMNDDFFKNFGKNVFSKLPIKGDLKTDIKETKDAYQVKIDMPGFDKKNIHINYDNDVLSIFGRRDSFSDESDKEGNTVYSERSYGEFSRQYNLPDVDRDKVSAKYDNGVLSLTLPKVETVEDSASHIEIE
ncbi:MAG: Hsp20/alpha crystallin family protein [Liquorilactobacillus ghanensis]|jgi:HSP20 family protein|uniref:Heat shock protein Hsp20 n=1 Tax=Liquorilactobacillus ghanensis DSM 18630 TaxID=1423750 RepID=A0A0R1VNC7_9LACO|nr:Hsp20/alpha crystallin family protein [Liquorilactobacillus ghanensis]KRM04724.1 heat shock protein Hsp20 [Liquorilactobacillus ghanensis DSM 18630]